MTERRFNEDEAADIFRMAAEADQTAPRRLAPGTGMTLRDLQEIGQEAGIPPELVARAAATLGQARVAAPRKFLGLPIGVARSVELHRRLTEQEWERLVVDLRETFNARGNVRTDGSFRQWTNGNLQALIEPTATGHRLRLRTVHGNALSFMALGIGTLAVAGVGVLLRWSTVGLSAAASGLSVVAMLGAGAFVFGALRIPAWARLRGRQMEDVAARLAATTATEDAGPGGDLR